MDEASADRLGGCRGVFCHPVLQGVVVIRIAPIIGGIAGVALAYLFGAAVAWDYDPAGWSTFWRLIISAFAVGWGFVGVMAAQS